MMTEHEISGAVRDKVSMAIDEWLRDEVSARRGDPEPGQD